MISPYPPIDSSRQKDLPSRDSFSTPDSKIQPTPPPPPPPSNTADPLSAISPSTEDSPQSLFDEAGALYYMQQFEDEGAHKNTVGGPRRIPTTISEGTDESTDDSTPNNMSPGKRSPATQVGSTQSIPMRRGTPGLLDRQMTNASMASSGVGGIESMLSSPATTHSLIGRKPSGARVPPASRKISASQKRVSDEDSQSDSIPQGSMSSQHALATANTSVDDNADALAALSFLDQEQYPVVTTPAKVAVLSPPPPPPPALPVVQAPSPPPASSEGAAQYKSSFAPSKQAAVRKARLQAQEAASHAAAHKPGRANGKQKSTVKDRVGWNQSSEEEEEEDDDDDDDDDDADSDEPRSRVLPSVSPIPAPAPVRPLHLRARDISPNGVPVTELNAYTQSRQSRNLPPIPGVRPGEFRCTLIFTCEF
jgi:CCR4-NOT transcriptional complex subunit CAF120